MARPVSEFPILPDESLAALRAISEANLVHLATVVRAVATGARTGGALDAPADTTLLTNEPCRLQPQGTRLTDQLQADQLNPSARWTLTFTVGTVIPPNSIATVSGAHPDGTPWVRKLRVLIAQTTRANEVMARYECVDVSPAGR